jgi:adenine C2-methylase RlmN of 23S rRNA A2503 and tRNA A37
MGLSGNLTTGEILEQVVHADRILALQWYDIKDRADGSQRIPKLDLVRNVVFMGMGEVRCDAEVSLAAKIVLNDSMCCSLWTITDPCLKPVAH